MKKILFFVSLLVAFTAAGQPAIKIFAYSQETSPGNIPNNVTDESGKAVVTKKGVSKNYYFFAAYPPSVKVSFCEAWIGGRYYKLQATPVDSTPVVMINYNIPDQPVKEVLVPASKLRVRSLSPLGSPSGKIIRANWFRKMLSQSELIISYIYKEKKYFIPVKKIKTLLPMMGI